MHLRTKNIDDIIYSSWDIECDRLILVIFGHFLPIYPHPIIQKNQNFEKIKTLLEIWLFFTSVAKTTIIWGTGPKIRRQTEVFVIFGHFLFFYPPNNLENQIFQKMSSFDTWVPKITIIWCMLPEIWSATNIIFCHFDPPNNLKNKNFEKIKKIKINAWRYYHFTQVHPKWQSYEVWFQRYEERLTKFFVILVHFLPFYSTKNPKNPKFKKIKKSTWRYHHFTQV